MPVHYDDMTRASTSVSTEMRYSRRAGFLQEACQRKILMSDNYAKRCSARNAIKAFTATRPKYWIARVNIVSE